MEPTVRLAIALTLTVLGSAASGLEQADEEASREVRKYIDCSGTRQTINTYLQGLASRLAENFKTTMQKNESYPKVPEQFWNDLPKVIAGEFNAHVDELIDKLIPLYVKHFTLEELKEINRFYERPGGVRLRESEPAMMQELSSVSAQWGQDVGRTLAGKILLSLGAYLTKPEEKK